MTATLPLFSDALRAAIPVRPATVDRSVVIGMLADVLLLPQESDYVPVGDFALRPDEMATGQPGAPSIGGKALRSALVQATGALKKEDRPAGGVPDSVSVYTQLEAIFGLTATKTDKKSARVACNIPLYREWTISPS